MELRWNGHKRMGSSPDLNEIPHEIPVARALFYIPMAEFGRAPGPNIAIGMPLEKGRSACQSPS
jgi:hypothetical protein